MENDKTKDLLKDNEDKSFKNLNDEGVNLQDNDKKKKILIISLVSIAVIVFVSIAFHSTSKKKDKKTEQQLISASDDRMEIQKDIQDKLKKMGEIKTKIINAQAHTATHSQSQAEIIKNEQGRIVDDQQTKTLMNAPLGMSMTDTHRVATKSETKTQATTSMVGQGGYAQFANSQPTSTSATDANWLQHPNYTVLQGEFMHAVLDTAISSEIQGSARATVTRAVYSYGDDRVLIPVGSRLVGQYAMTNQGGNGVAASRVFIIWNRVITPNGISIMINSNSEDSLGVTGQGADYIDTHFFKMFGTSIMLSLIGAGSSNMNSGANGATAQQQYQAAIQQSMAQTSATVLSKYTNIAPTLYVDQGTQINVYIAKDLDLYKAMHRRA